METVNDSVLIQGDNSDATLKLSTSLNEAILVESEGGATFTSGSELSGRAWSNTSNAQTFDSNNATSSTATTGITDYLKATTFSFAIPANATIQGIGVSVSRYADVADNTADNSVKLIVNDVVVGSDNAKTNYWETDPTWVDYGHSADMWGLTLTADDVNDAGFGVAFSATSIATDSTPVNNIRIKVYYVDEINQWHVASSYEDGNGFHISHLRGETTKNFLSVDNDGNTKIRFGDVQDTAGGDLDSATLTQNDFSPTFNFTNFANCTLNWLNYAPTTTLLDLGNNLDYRVLNITPTVIADGTATVGPLTALKYSPVFQNANTGVDVPSSVGLHNNPTVSTATDVGDLVSFIGLLDFPTVTTQDVGEVTVEEITAVDSNAQFNVIGLSTVATIGARYGMKFRDTTSFPYGDQGTLTVTDVVALDIDEQSFGSNIYGVRSALDTGHFLYSTGTAPSSLTGGLRIGDTSDPTAILDVVGEQRFIGASSGYVGFVAAAAAGSQTYILPDADGSSGDALVTDGSGVLSWSSSGGSSQWVDSGSDIYFDAGNVAIGTNTPTYKLTVHDEVTGQTANNVIVDVKNDVAEYDTSGGVITSTGALISSVATKSGGANDLTNVGLVILANSGDRNNGLIVTASGGVPISAQFNKQGSNLEDSFGVTTLTIDSASYDTTAGDIVSIGGTFVAAGTKSGGANNLTNVGIYATAANGDSNFAAAFEGPVIFQDEASDNKTITDVTALSADRTFKFADADMDFDAAITGNYTVLTSLPSTFATLHFTNGILTSVT